MIRFGDAWDYFRHQLQSSSTPRHMKPRRDGDGRRLRASAHGRPRVRTTSVVAVTPRSYSWASIVAKAMVAVILASVAFVGSSKVYISFAGNLPDANALAAERLNADTLVYAADGKTLLADLHYPGEQHYDESLSAMGTLLPNATIAIEDSNFYHEPGIDITGIVRAAWIDWREHRPVQGASTITQQLVKLRLTKSAEPTLTRKIREAMLALQVERSFSKHQILEMYLNTVYYANDAYGSAAASQIYFHTTTARLDLAQASMLAGIPQNPTYNNPFANPTGAKARQHDVLQAMVRNHMITQQEATAAYAEDLNPPNHMFRPQSGVIAPGFVDYITHVLRSNYGDAGAYAGGFHVLTTLDVGLQQIAERDLRRNLNQNGPVNGFSQEALTSLDPHTGAIVAMVGSMPGHPGSNYNFAAYVPRQPGSSMKVYTYTAGIASGKYTMVTPIADTPILITARYTGDKDYRPTNYDGSYHGVCQYQACLGNSYNIPALKVELGLGVPAVIQMARTMGAPPWGGNPWSQDAPLDSYPISSTLGGVYETPLQMAQGFSVLASAGVLHPAFGVQKITTSDGAEVYKANPQGNSKQVIDPRVAFIMSQIMSDNDNRINAFGSTSEFLIQPNRRIAAKTGTTQDFRDGWTVGFTPALVTAIWTGNADNTPLVYGYDAVLDAGPAFHDYMFDATNYIREPGSDWFNQPPGLVALDLGGKAAYFLPGTSPDQAAPPLPSWVVTSNPTQCVRVHKRYVCSSSPTPTQNNNG